VADCIQPDKFSFEIVPHDMPMLPFIQKGIAETHPEFKQDVIKPKAPAGPSQLMMSVSFAMSTCQSVSLPQRADLKRVFIHSLFGK
jgi:hypothetical protein